jgi:MFS family permease
VIPHRTAGGGRPTRGFGAFWFGQTVAELGSQVGFVAIPLLAAASLRATAWDMGLLVALETLPALIVSLPAGVFVDRHSRRRVLIATDIARAATLLLIPAAWAAGMLSLGVLYIVVLVAGGLTVVFDVAYQSYVPEILGPEELATGNQRLEMSASGAQVAGPGVAGVLVATLGAAGAVLLDGFAYVVSAAAIARSRPPDETRPKVRSSGSVRSQAAEGLRLVWADRALRDLAASTATFNLGSAMILAVFVLFGTRELGLSAGEFGLLYGLGNVGFFLGAAASARLARRLGVGSTIFMAACLAAVATLLLPLAIGPAAVLLLFAGRFTGAVATPIYNVALVTFVQHRAPVHMLGRINATFRFIDWSTVPLGALLGGALATGYGLRATLAAAAVLGVARLWFLIGSPARQVRLGASDAPEGAGRPRPGPAPITGSAELVGVTATDDAIVAR